MMLRHTFLTLAIVVSAVPGVLGAQAPRLDLGGAIVANGEAERYLRLMQLTGRTPLYPVAIRPWTRVEAAGLTPTAAHPWASRFAVADSGRRPSGGVQLLRASLGATANSGFPEGEGEGPVWLGRGLTVQGEWGARFTAGAFELQLAPVAFWAQNTAFTLAPNGEGGVAALRDARFARLIDAPQRFGTTPYARLDPGYSRAGVDTRWISLGVSTMPLAWGPARDEPLVLGPGAGGFPHLFVGSGEPLPVGIGTLHVKLITGQLAQSGWSPVTTGDRLRVGTGAVLSFAPRGVRGLEVGIVRFQHRIWRDLTFGEIWNPFTSILSDPKRDRNTANENGYASAFFRWGVAPAGFEIYGEYGREDYAGNFRWLLQKPDDLGNLLLGFQRVFGSGATGMNVLRAELVNGELSSNERGQRGFTQPFAPYIHSGVFQGHTLRGQILGSPTAFGGAGWRMALDRYRTGGRTSWIVQRALLRDWLPVPPPAGTAQRPEVRYSLRMEQLRFQGRVPGETMLTGGVTWALNQRTLAGKDGFNVQAGVAWRAP